MKLKKEKGITLVALVVTIIVLIILAGISIATLTGENGLLTKVTEAKKQAIIAEEKEQLTLAYNAATIKTGENSSNISVTTAELNTELDKQKAGATANGENPITVEFAETGNIYTIDINSEEKIVGPINNAESPEEEDSTQTGQIPEGYIKPEGTMSITQNGEYDVKAYEKAKVNVPTNTPTGTIKITEQKANIDVSGYQYADTSGITGEGGYWAYGTFTLNENNIKEIDIGFIPNRIIFTKADNGASAIYNSSISKNSQIICSISGITTKALNLENDSGSRIICSDNTMSSTIKFNSSTNTTWHWFATK